MVVASNPLFITRETEEVYRANGKDFLSSHQLADFRKCPFLYHQKKSGLITDEDRPAFQIGRAAHTLILEGCECFTKRYAVGGPINPKTGASFGVNTKAYTEWAQSQGRPVLTSEHSDLVMHMAASVKAHGDAQKLLEDGIPEAVVRMDYRDVACQIRMDWYARWRGLVDLKTCDDLMWFEADARRFGYVYQLAFYRSVLAIASGQNPDSIPVHFIAVEKKPPYRCGTWIVCPDSLRQATAENEAAMERLKACELTGVWPTGYEETRTFDSL